MLQTITVNMIDGFTGKPVTREIDISNFSVNDCSAPAGWECDKIEDDKEKQRALLERWINERANDQHDTFLELVSWSVA